ncbi:MAG TPA: type I restriction enzyme HsdR N-terminal domain-containing protein [Alphaproteobacteria bacterium]|nr:type I restriction enzyme HsdR N-terminal domain-containing protein [Alphaproteobacteria bacterium]
MSIPKRVAERLSSQLKRYAAILSAAKDRDINESDTVIIIADMLSEVFGYKKHTEVTTEVEIRGTHVDLAIKVDDETRFLVEAKSINTTLKDNHVKQAIDYGANHGIEWVVLTNAVVWQIYKIHFRQPIDKTLVYEVNLLEINHRDRKAIDCLAMLSREEFSKKTMTAFYQQQEAVSRFSLAAAIESASVLKAMRKELKKMAPRVSVTDDELRQLLEKDVIKREIVESEETARARAIFSKAARVAARTKIVDTAGGAEGIGKPTPETSSS